MSDEEPINQPSEPAGTAPKADSLKPEEQGHAVPGKGEALEPEALHPAGGGAASTADKMWGPPGTPPKAG